MAAIEKLPPRVRHVPEVRGLAKQLERARRSLREERAARESGGRKTLGIQAGAALAGAVATIRPTVGPVPTAVAGALLAFGGAAATGSSDLLNLANGLLAPVTAAAVARRLGAPELDDDDTGEG